MFLTCGILHDIGKFILSNPLYEAYIERTGAITPSRSKELSAIEKEDRVFGINHMAIGKLLGDKWGLSEKLCAVMEFHHHPSLGNAGSIPSEHAREVAAVCFADLIVNRVYETAAHAVPEKKWFDLVGLKYPIEDNITPDIQDSWKRRRVFVYIID